MNIKINIRLQDEVLQTEDDEIIIFNKGSNFFSGSILLNPLYALPSDISDLFLEDGFGPYEQILYRICFEGSLEADRLLSSSRASFWRLDPQTIFYIKRKYVICYATYHFSKVFYRDYLKAVKKTKFLADLKVSLEIQKEPDLINQVQGDAKNCMMDISSAIMSTDSMNIFVKGSCNPCNKTAHRLWFPSLGHNYPDEITATARTVFGGTIYGIGTQHDYGAPY